MMVLFVFFFFFISFSCAASSATLANVEAYSVLGKVGGESRWLDLDLEGSSFVCGSQTSPVTQQVCLSLNTEEGIISNCSMIPTRFCQVHENSTLTVQDLVLLFSPLG
jgi:hypothetical protein